MTTIETTANVGDDRTLTIQSPTHVVPGVHRVVVMVEEQATPRKVWTIDDWPIHDEAINDSSQAFRREEIYGDDGR